MAARRGPGGGQARAAARSGGATAVITFSAATQCYLRLSLTADSGWLAG